MVFHPTYFSSILQYAIIIQSDTIVFEVFDNYQKQTYRNRCYVYGANGKQTLNVPIQKKTGKQFTKDIKIDYSFNWQLAHLKTLHSAYNSSPFFEYYIDDLQAIFSKKETFLIDLNFKTFDVIMNLLEEQKKILKTEDYHKEYKADYRFLVNAKNRTEFDLPKYRQVFDTKYNFLTNLSILDLLFMEGTIASIYLERLNIPQVINLSTT